LDHALHEVSDEFRPDAKIVILHGDCLETLKNVPSGSVRLVISSPPYNIGKQYEKTKALGVYLDSIKPVLEELTRIVAIDGSVCWQVGNYVRNGEIVPLDVCYYPIFSSLGFRLRNRIIWHFNHGLHASKRFSGRYETICWFTKSDSYVFNLDAVRVPSKYPGKTHFKGPNRGLLSGNPLGKNPSDFWSVIAQDWDRLVWEIPNVKANHPEKTIHPCQFPIELAQRCILALTGEDDLVLDPFGGVGTSLIAAVMHNRRAILCESDDAYVKVANQRLEQYFQGSLRIRPLGKFISQQAGKKSRKFLSHGPTRLRVGQMNIVARYSFNGGEEAINERFAELLEELTSSISAVNASDFKIKVSREKTMAGRLLYSPKGLNMAIFTLLDKKGWRTERIKCDYSATTPNSVTSELTSSSGAFREMDFVKRRLGIEIQLGKYAFMVYNVCAKMTIFHNLDIIDMGIEVVPMKSLPDEMSTGVSYFEQIVWDLEHRGVSNIDIPVLILGIDA